MAPSSENIVFTSRTSDFLKIGVAAAAQGNIEKVRCILKARPNWIHRIGSHGRTMLWEASHKGKLDMVRYLVRRKADINACGSHYTPYFVDVSCYCIARYKNHDKVADFLLHKGARINIHTAAFLGQLDEVQKYVQTDQRLIHSGHDQTEMAEKRSPQDFVVTPTEWATPLCYALRGGDVATVDFLLKQKSRVRGFERELFIAANGQVSLIRLLLEADADPTKMTDVLPDERELAELLKSYGGRVSDVHKISDELVYLCRGDRGGNCAEVERLLKLGADVNFQDSKGKTAVHRAAKAGFLKTLDVLFAHHAQVNLTDKKGNTALHDTVVSTIRDQQKKRQAIDRLLQEGADPQAENFLGKTPHSLASSGRFADAIVIQQFSKFNTQQNKSR